MPTHRHRRSRTDSDRPVVKGKLVNTPPETSSQVLPEVVRRSVSTRARSTTSSSPNRIMAAAISPATRLRRRAWSVPSSGQPALRGQLTRSANAAAQSAPHVSAPHRRRRAVAVDDAR